ncbi:UDP-N-acetylmuramoyl-tripeptide--D-alanyl-D-alanine ligase [Candidatus Nomurabacteria bacterium]|nr:UDP-N-acetylmuramoyl-tripeptide--D-alanyl-D-alanine ligase [Candidatus Nomurabacteria bacterium]
MKFFLKKLVAYILRIESRLVIRKYKPKIIAITGSVGKTSTKDAVFAVLSGITHVRKSEKSYNSEIGLPLTILGVPNGWNNPFVWLKNILKGLWLFVAPHKYPKWLVLEVGVGQPGDIRRTASWLKTDAVIITAIGETPAHIEFFNSRKVLIEEKSQLIKTLKKEGLLVINADDEDALSMQNGVQEKHRTVTYGFREGSDITGSSPDILYDRGGAPHGVIFRIDAGGNSLPVSIGGVFGKNHVYASLAAIALASGLKFNVLSAIDSLKEYDVSPGRMKLLKGINDSLIIDDTYNSSPTACRAALETLGEVKTKENKENKENQGRKIAVLGDMLQLGRHTGEAHKNIGVVAARILGKKGVLLTVGPRAKSIMEGAIGEGMKEKNIFEFVDSSGAGEFLENFVKKDDLILVKGSQDMRMERTVEKILLDKESKEKLLVRQEEEWKNRI